MEKNVISVLMEYERDTDFFEACYRLLLNREISSSELGNRLRLLADGMSRRAFIYSVMRSPEFGKRFSADGMRACMVPFLLYGVNRKIKSGLAFACKDMPLRVHPMKEKNMQLLLPGGSDTESCGGFESEFNALALGQISQLAVPVQPAVSGKQCVAEGYLASEIIRPVQPSVIDAEHWKKDPGRRCGVYFATNPQAVHGLLNGQGIAELSRRVQDYFIFTMPKLPMRQGALCAIWDSDWEKTDYYGKNCYRWFSGHKNHGKILLFNNSNQYRRVRIRGTLISLNKNADLILVLGSQRKRYHFRKTKVRIEETFYLNPYCNEIPFFYTGDGRDAAEQKQLNFAIENLSLRDCVTGGVYSGEQVYGPDCETFGSGYYPYMMSDFHVRTLLHSQGFFEVEAHLVTKDYEVKRLDTTRYYYGDTLLRGKGYYTFSQGVQEELDSQTGVTVYLAHRQGKMSAASFHSHAAGGKEA